MNLLAPEHAELAVRDARAVGARRSTPQARSSSARTRPSRWATTSPGPSHVLPTGGSARFASPLGVADFVKRTSIIEYEPPRCGLRATTSSGSPRSRAFRAHARSVAARTRGTTGG